VILPRKFRDELGQDMVITKGVGKERCLYVFPQAEFEAFAAKLHSQPLTARPTRDFARMFVAGASSETADSQGRVVIPQPLREYAGLTRDVVLLGQIRRVEIWDKAGVGALPGGRRGRLRRRDQRRPPRRAGDLMVLTAARHQPVMVDRVPELLRPRPGGTYLDATLGLGGHTERLLEASAPDGRVVGWTATRPRWPWPATASPGRGTASRPCTPPSPTWPRWPAASASRPSTGSCTTSGCRRSSWTRADRGFSYRADAPLDMRMDPTTGITAAEVLATYPRAELARILREYGEERFAGRIARVLDEARRRGPVATTGQLAELVKTAVPAAARRTGPHPARRAFQALRIEVNRELDALRASLPQAIDLLAPGGRLVVLSYHSLEDRIVKQALAEAAGGPVEAPSPFRGSRHEPPGPPGLPVDPPVAQAALVTVLTRRPERPDPSEVAANPRAESAKLRAAEKLQPATEARGGQR
jgi:16S rRNA (cytosine1402-N4)-methyltransferase